MYEKNIHGPTHGQLLRPCMIFFYSVGRCGYWFFKWGIRSEKSCGCRAIDQTLSHIMNSCNLRKFQGSHFELLEGKLQRAMDWIVQLDLNI